VFSSKAESAQKISTTIVSESAYQCIHGGDVVKSDDTVGLLRKDGFRPVTTQGKAFLKASGNPLAVHL